MYAATRSATTRLTAPVTLLRSNANRTAAVARWCCNRVRVGEVLGVSLPRRGLTLADGAKRHVFIAGGIGITPFLSMAAALRRAGTDFILHLSARGEPPLRASVAPLAASGRAVLHDTRAGRPDPAALIGSPDPGTQLYCCGPRGMIAAFEEAAMRAGWPQGQTHVEHFVPLPTEHDGPRYAIVLARSRISGEVPAGGSALAALRALGVEVDASARQSIAIACCRRPNESGTSWSASRAAPARGSSSICEARRAGQMRSNRCSSRSELRDGELREKIADPKIKRVQMP
jgi:ferredoxin-NADP reductase